MAQERERADPPSHPWGLVAMMLRRLSPVAFGGSSIGKAPSHQLAAGGVRHLTAVVTGGGSGIGKALSLQLAAGGVDTIIVGRREKPLLQVAGEHSKIRTCVADIGTPEGQAAIQGCVGDAPLHFLVHNAAMMPMGTLATTSLSTWRTTMSANVEAPLFLTQALLPNLEKVGGSAKVLFISSGVADIEIPGLLTYCVSKATLKKLWKSLSLELVAKGVHVGYCLPGLVDTTMPTTMANADGFVLNDLMAKRIEGGDIHTPQELGHWLAALLDEEKVNSTLFREREHNIDMPGHDLGVKLTLTSEGKHLAGGGTTLTVDPEKEL